MTQVLQQSPRALLLLTLPLPGAVLVAILSPRCPNTDIILWKRYVLKPVTRPGAALKKLFRFARAPWP